jgi:hypothetical protein
MSEFLDPRLDGRPGLHPSIRFPFTDVVEELRAIAELASQAVEVEGSLLAMACRRAESLLRVLGSNSWRTSCSERASKPPAGEHSFNCSRSVHFASSAGSCPIPSFGAVERRENQKGET